MVFSSALRYDSGGMRFGEVRFLINGILNNSRYFYWLVAVFFFSLLTVGLIAERHFKIAPCGLCYYQRYVTIGLIVASLAVVISKVDHKAFTGLIVAGALGGAVLSGFHIGVERKWWAMPASCSSDVEITSTDPMEMLKSLRAQTLNRKQARCDRVDWYILGAPASWFAFVAFLSAGLIMGWREWRFPRK